MQCSIKRRIIQLVQVRLHVLVIFSVLVLVLAGRVPDSQGGWITCPPQAVIVVPARRGRGCKERPGRRHDGGCWLHLFHTCSIPLMRSLLLWAFWHLSGPVGPAWVGMVPLGLWLWQRVGVLWPWLRRQPEWQGMKWLLWQGQRGLMIGYLGLTIGTLLRREPQVTFTPPAWDWLNESRSFWMVGLGCVVCHGEEPWAEVVQEEDGSYTATLCGHFTLGVAGDHPFRARMLMLFLRLLEGPGPQRGGRRTRDGRTPFVAQEKLAAWFQLPQPDISRIEKYWLEGDWPNLLSLKTAEVLTQELVRRIVTVFVTFPWWRVEKVYHYLQEQGVAVSWRQVRQAAEQSGWSQLRQELMKRYHLTAEGIRPKDGWLVEQLLTQVRALLSKLEGEEGLTPEEQMAVADLQTLAAEVGMVAQPPLKALPWMMCVERVVFGHWQEVTDGPVRCLYCGSTHVVRKSRKPRLKKYYDAEGNLQAVEVYRYYCRNPLCDKGSFTNLPPGLVPYSRYRTEVHLLAVQMYAWGYSTYRRTGQALGVASMTAYRWVSAWGYELLPVAALFGVVKSSGVVGIDEKYVLVPKNDKPEGDMRRWMYVYFAVDVYTYDLLHIALYPYNNKDSALAFLLALRAKGYHPRIIVTDLRRDYGSLIAQVFSKAQHHECIFHALQNVQDDFKEVYGAGYAETHPEAEALKQEIYRVFDAKTKRTAQKRYEKVMALRAHYVQETPAAAVIFDFLERHWPTLVNGIESSLIPTTNNTVELVIRRFDQHYQNFCGFDTIETAQLFLGVFEKVYRFTPFSQDAQPRIRGKCPLELAGYDISQVPMASLCAGWSLAWPLEVDQNLVPNS
jgi:transposase-like protein